MARFTAPRVWLGLLSVALLPVLLGTAGVAVTDHLESERRFCVSCHLPNGRPLHEFKFSVARDQSGLDLTGVHFQHALQGRFTCADCHRGVGWQERTHVLVGSAINTLRYGVGSYREPEALARPLQNEACTGCHQSPTRNADRSRFHGTLAHLDQRSVRCTDCHLGHATAAEPATEAQRLAQASRLVCSRCHKGDPPAPHVLATLETYRTDLLRRMGSPIGR